MSLLAWIAADIAVIAAAWHLVGRHTNRATTATRIDCYVALLRALDDVKILATDDQPTTLGNVLTQIRVAYEVHADIDVEVIHVGADE